MKRLLSIITLLLVISSVSAKSFFSDRYVELQVGVPVSFSTNALPLKDVFKKDLVIDLREIAEKMPDEGFIATFNADPIVAMNFNFGKIFVGMSTGFEVFERFSLSKDLFDFLGKGNTIGQSIDVTMENNIDVFFDINLDVGVKFKRYDLHVKPTVFVPIVSMMGDAGKVSFVNDDKGNFNVKMNSDMNFRYSFDPDDIEVGSLLHGMGVDIGASFRHPIGERLETEFDARIPVVPGRLDYMSNVKYNMEYNMSFMDMANAQSTNTETTTKSKGDVFYINRPMKFTSYIEYSPLGYLLLLKGGLGLGVYHPFIQGMTFYPEYYLGFELNLGNILKICLSDEYTNRVFKNQISMDVNLRIIELEAGVSLQAASFTKSFIGTGYGAYVLFSIGY